MTAAEFIRVVELVDLSRWPFPLKVRAHAYEGGFMFEIVVTMTVNDRMTGAAINVSTVQRLDGREVDGIDRSVAIDRVYDAVKHTVLHELKECFIVDGVRVMDPHQSPIHIPGLKEALGRLIR